ncbi:uncharacterized protein TRAVEDRAFT_52038 [Trametes versicolor FP-101664 SS1]|uniref:uncharacterized protein n=1 Tax=Trametes versicolor (strain FP-101664) TaxID=717944 RepID=UPI0004622A07|nr:uncharacterized protein TRAVEDRAFT_52038 [Trametes versicolor FP-101664 SS1]EIW54331.1 hypothetical protein TRAVEDRAFT_52038 [Trametes versicolor FP-101664 SS1]
MFEGIARHNDHQAKLPNITDVATFLAMVSSYTDESLGLGVTPLVCGDKLLDHNATATQQNTNDLVQSLARDRARAPALASDAFPALHYLCHLWPVRAAERYSGTNDTAALHVPRPGPARPHLQIVSHEGPLTSFRVWVPPGHWGSAEFTGATFVFQSGFGIPMLSHSQCMTDGIADYLRNGTAPLDGWCDGGDRRSEISAGMVSRYDEDMAASSTWRRFFAGKSALALLILSVLGTAVLAFKVWRSFSHDRKGAVEAVLGKVWTTQSNTLDVHPVGGESVIPEKF